MNNIVLAAQAAQGGGMSMIIMMVAIFAIMWFFMIKPQRKRQKEIENFRKGLTIGSKVMMEVMTRVFLCAFSIGVSLSLEHGDPQHDLLEYGGVELVVDEGALPALEHEVSLLQDLEVVGDGGCGHVEVGADLAGGKRSCAEQL